MLKTILKGCTCKYLNESHKYTKMKLDDLVMIEKLYCN
jgi:hypothetical protein